MELNLDFLFKQGKALKDYTNTDAEEDQSTSESVLEASKILKTDTKTDDEKTVDESTAEPIKTKKEDTEKDEEQSLEEKLQNIEKVIETFSGKSTVIDSGQRVGKAPSINLNQQPLDMGTAQAKAYQAEYLKPSSLPDDRIALLYDNLKKYNLI
tara:strand:- start:353 stop:814 length:462 start_codon:yes stop_codon:yes gene_type:complete